MEVSMSQSNDVAALAAAIPAAPEPVSDPTLAPPVVVAPNFELPPAPPISIAGAKRGARAAAPAVPPAAPRGLSQLLPEAHLVRVRRRTDGADFEFVGEFRPEAIRPDGGLEPFIAKRLAPRLGGGEFHVWTVRQGSQNEEYRGSVTIVQPEVAPAGADPAGMLEKAMALVAQLQDKLQAETKAQAQALREAEASRDALAAKVKESDLAGQIALLRDRQERSAAPRDDETTRHLLRELRRLRRAARRPAAPPPAAFGALTPPAPAPDPMESVGKLVESLGGILRPPAPALAAPSGEGITIEKVIQWIPVFEGLLGRLTGASSIAELRAELARNQERFEKLLTREPRSLAQTVQEVRDLRAVASEILPERPSSDTFVDLVDRLLDPERISALGELITNLRAGGGAEGAPAPAPASRISENPQPPAERTYPDGFDRLLKGFTAADPSKVVQAVLLSLQALGRHPGWRPEVAGILRRAARRDKDAVMSFVSAYLSALVADGRLTADVAGKVEGVFRDNLEVIVAHVAARAGAAAGAAK
jgi:hypothetical protein